MGWASEQWIENHNERMESDEQYAADYEESMRIDAALEEEFFEWLTETEKQVDWFDDLKIDVSGYTEIHAPVIPQLFISEDVPF